jgi:hypothetical protein
MLVVKYNHPLHGEQNIKCKDLLNKEGVLHARNIHGVTFQTLEPNRIVSVNCNE